MYFQRKVILLFSSCFLVAFFLKARMSENIANLKNGTLQTHKRHTLGLLRSLHPRRHAYGSLPAPKPSSVSHCVCKGLVNESPNSQLLQTFREHQIVPVGCILIRKDSVLPNTTEYLIIWEIFPVQSEENSTRSEIGY